MAAYHIPQAAWVVVVQVQLEHSLLFEKVVAAEINLQHNRWCTCSMLRISLPCDKLIGLLLFSLLFLVSILFLKPNIHTYIH